MYGILEWGEMVKHALFLCLWRIEHEDSTEHGQWIDTIDHESVETVEKVNSCG